MKNLLIVFLISLIALMLFYDLFSLLPIHTKEIYGVYICTKDKDWGWVQLYESCNVQKIHIPSD